MLNKIRNVWKYVGVLYSPNLMIFLTFPFFDLTTKCIITDILLINFLFTPHIPVFIILYFILLYSLSSGYIHFHLLCTFCYGQLAVNKCLLAMNVMTSIEEFSYNRIAEYP